MAIYMSREGGEAINQFNHGKYILREDWDPFMRICMSRKDCYPINQFLPTDVVSSNPTQSEVSCDKVCHEFAVRWFFQGTLVSPTNKTASTI